MPTATLENKTGFAVDDFVRPPELHLIPFTMPKLSVGQIVNWYPNCNYKAKPVPTVVLEVHPRHASLAACGSGFQVSPYGVRHAQDPMTQKPVERTSGCWEYTEEFRQRERDRASLDSALRTIAHLSHCLKTIAADLQTPLPECPQEEGQPTEEACCQPEPISPEQAARNAAELEAAMASDAGELETENASTKRRGK